MRSYSIVASNYIKGAEDFLKTLQPGVTAVLVREPTNKFDPSAVAVWIDGRKVGYVPKAQNKVLAQFIDQAGTPLLTGVAEEHVIAMDAAAGSGSNNPNPLRAVLAKFVRSPNSNFPMVEV